MRRIRSYWTSLWHFWVAVWVCGVIAYLVAQAMGNDAAGTTAFYLTLGGWYLFLFIRHFLQGLRGVAPSPRRALIRREMFKVDE